MSTVIRFTIGNIDTLNVSNIRDQVVDYYNKRYSANVVSPVCCAVLSIALLLGV